MKKKTHFVLSFIPPDVLDEIFDLIESVSEGFPTYPYTNTVYFVDTQYASNTVPSSKVYVLKPSTQIHSVILFYILSKQN